MAIYPQGRDEIGLNGSRTGRLRTIPTARRQHGWCVWRIWH